MRTRSPSRSPELAASEHARRDRRQEEHDASTSNGTRSERESPVSAPGWSGASIRPPVCSASCASVERPSAVGRYSAGYGTSTRTRRGPPRAAWQVDRQRIAAGREGREVGRVDARRVLLERDPQAVPAGTLEHAGQPRRRRRARPPRGRPGAPAMSPRAAVDHGRLGRHAPGGPAHGVVPERRLSRPAGCPGSAEARRPRHDPPGAVAPLRERGFGPVAGAARDQVDLRARAQPGHDVARERRQLDARPASARSGCCPAAAPAADR